MRIFFAWIVGRSCERSFPHHKEWLLKITAVVDGDRFARVYSIDEQRLLVELPHDGLVRGGAFGPGSAMLVTGSADRLARVWNLETFTLTDTLRGHQVK